MRVRVKIVIPEETIGAEGSAFLSSSCLLAGRNFHALSPVSFTLLSPMKNKGLLVVFDNTFIKLFFIQTEEKVKSWEFE